MMLGRAQLQGESLKIKSHHMDRGGVTSFMIHKLVTDESLGSIHSVMASVLQDFHNGNPLLCLGLMNVYRVSNMGPVCC